MPQVACGVQKACRVAKNMASEVRCYSPDLKVLKRNKKWLTNQTQRQLELVITRQLLWSRRSSKRQFQKASIGSNSHQNSVSMFGLSFDEDVF